MRCLFVSQCGESLALALRVQSEGAEVRWYVHDREMRDVGRGLVQRVPDWRSHLSWADLVVFDEVAMKEDHGQAPYGGGKWAAEVRRRGIPTIGGTQATDDLERDRKFGQEVCRHLGLPVVPMTAFRGPGAFDAAARYVRSHPDGYALKHNAETDKNLTTVQWTPDAMLRYLDWLQAVWPRVAPGIAPDFVLQRAEKGVEISTTAVFSGHGWTGVMVPEEYKRLMAGNVGPQTGSMGEVAFMDDASKLWKKGLEPLGGWLEHQGYHGVIDLSYIATPEKLVPLEFTARFGYLTIFNLANLYDGPVLDLLHHMATGEGKPRWRPGWSAAVLMGSGMFPYGDKRRNDGLYLGGDWQNEDVWPAEVQAPQGWGVWNGRPGALPDHLESAAGSGDLCSCTGYGAALQEARDAAYGRIAKLDVLPTRIYRDDIGRYVEKDMARLREWGWLQ